MEGKGLGPSSEGWWGRVNSSGDPWRKALYIWLLMWVLPQLKNIFQTAPVPVSGRPWVVRDFAGVQGLRSFMYSRVQCVCLKHVNMQMSHISHTVTRSTD